MNEISAIWITWQRERIGKHYCTRVTDVVWDGPLGSINADYLDGFPSCNNLFEIGPYIAKLVEIDIYGFAILAKIDHPFAAIYPAWRLLRSAWQWFMARFVYTLAVWGVGELSTGWRLYRVVSR